MLVQLSRWADEGWFEREDRCEKRNKESGFRNTQRCNHASPHSPNRHLPAFSAGTYTVSPSPRRRRISPLPRLTLSGLSGTPLFSALPPISLTSSPATSHTKTPPPRRIIRTIQTTTPSPPSHAAAPWPRPVAAGDTVTLWPQARIRDAWSGRCMQSRPRSRMARCIDRRW